MGAFWTRGRDRSAESENVAVAGPRARSWRLTAVDRCDRCGAQAYVRVLLPGRLELLFCAHHNRQYSSALADIAVEIQDETMRLAAVPYPEFVLSRFPDLGCAKRKRVSPWHQRVAVLFQRVADPPISSTATRREIVEITSVNRLARVVAVGGGGGSFPRVHATPWGLSDPPS